jgi:CDP-paratose 2-epimerase
MNILITGGFGFIGLHTAKHFARNSNNNVYILDNFSRIGNSYNYSQLEKYPNVNFVIMDIKNYFDLVNLFVTIKFDTVIHLAAQVAVTTSIVNPRQDFDANCLGTFNLLECCRLYSPQAIILYASTNKVYGKFDLSLQETDTRYKAINFDGISEMQQLDFYSPYGCSKGCGDQYVIDYNRIYGLKTVCLRQSCIYGPNQFGIEDQGWVSWFAIAAIFNKSITIYGDGKQVRDTLYISDLVKLYDLIIQNIDICQGQAYNVGGGIRHTISLIELISLLSTNLNKNIPYSFDNWRPGDQKVYISDIQKLYKDIDWEPTTNIIQGVKIMLTWIKNNQSIFQELSLI